MRFLPGLHPLVRFSESFDQGICFCYRTQGHVQTSGHRVGAGVGLALGALGVPTHPEGRSSGIRQGLVDRFPDEVLRGHVPLMRTYILIGFLYFLFPPLGNGSEPQCAGCCWREVRFSSCDPHNWNRQASTHCFPPPRWDRLPPAGGQLSPMPLGAGYVTTNKRWCFLVMSLF